MNICDLPKEAILSKSIKLSKEESCSSVVTLNSLMLMETWRNTDLESALRNAALIIADSIGVQIATFLLKGKVVFRYPGIELMERVIASGARSYLIGGRPGVAEAAADVLTRRYRDCNICGVRDGFFEKSEEKLIIKEINETAPEAVFVGLSMKKQQLWIEKIRKKIKRGIIMGVGGSFDVISGRLSRAPRWLRYPGGEWVWRVFLEPWRIVRIAGLLLFPFGVFKRFFKKRKSIL